MTAGLAHSYGIQMGSRQALVPFASWQGRRQAGEVKRTRTKGLIPYSTKNQNES